jgi:hypothetical protein
MKYLSGIGFGQASGSVAGTTASNNRYGAYYRNRAMPVNPSSTKQGIVRSRFGSLSQQWRGLTQAQRNAWNAEASTTVLIDSLGQQYAPTGAQLYVGVNQILLALGLSAVTNPPANPGQAVITSASATAVGSTGVVTVTFAPAIASGAYYELRATAPVSAGRSYFGRSQYKTLGYLDNTDTSPFVATTDYAAVYGGLTTAATGRRIGFELVPINSGGYKGVPYKFTAIIS